MIALAAVVLGLALGAASGGSIRALDTASLRFEWPVLLLFVIQAVARGRIAGAAASRLGVSIWVCSCIALLLLSAADWRQLGIWVVGVGIALNILVVLLNGGMPVAFTSQASAGAAAVSVAPVGGFYQLAGPGTVVGVLGDVLPLSVGGYRILVSPGDVLMALGVALFIVAAMGNRRESVSDSRFQGVDDEATSLG